MSHVPQLFVFGAIFIAALVVHVVAPRIKLPRVTLLMLLGVAVGPVGFDWLPPDRRAWFATTTDLALAMIGFLLGGEFTLAAMRRHGKALAVLSVGLAAGTAVIVTAGAWLLGVPLPVALLLGGIAPATAPAATVAVLDELEVDSPFATTIRGIVALDDIWGLLLYSLAAAAAAGGAMDGAALDGIMHALVELGTACGVGLALGLAATPLAGRLRGGRPTVLEALGLVLICAGGAEWLDVSPLLAAVAMGATLANLTPHDDLAFREIEDLEWPVLVLFFVFAGASLELHALSAAGLLVPIYVGLRIVGRFVGLGLASAGLGCFDRSHTRWLPLALMPQAGVALGLALSATRSFPEYADTLLSVVIASTLIFELTGPPLTRFAVLSQAREPTA